MPKDDTQRFHRYLRFSLLLALTVTLLIMLPRLANPYSAEDDFRNWYWMHRFQDAELFVDDYWINNQILEFNLGPLRFVTYKASPLYGLVYQLLSYFFPVILLGKLLVFPLTLAAVYYLYLICHYFTDARTAFVISGIFVLLNLSLTSMVSTVGGFQRSFVFPLLLAYLYYLIANRPRAALVVMFFSGVIYPPLFVLQVAAYGLDLLYSWWSNRHTESGRQYGRQLGGITALVFVTVLLLFPVLQDRLMQIAGLNTLDNWHALFEATKFGPNGRVRMFLIFPFVGRGGVADHGITIIVIMFLALFAAVIMIWQPKRLRAFPRPVKSLFWASWLLFFAAWIVFLPTAVFLLYLPSRYTQSSVVLVLFIFVMIHGEDATKAAASWISEQVSSVVWITVPSALFLLALFFLLPELEPNALAFGRGETRWILLVLAVVLVIFTAVLRRRSKSAVRCQKHKPVSRRVKLVGGLLCLLLGIAITWGLQPLLTYYVATDVERGMYAYLKTLPKDVMLAGDPVVIDAVPLFGERRVLFSRGRIHPDEDLVNDTLLAYYAESPLDLLTYCQTYGVDYLVVNQNDFEVNGLVDHQYFYEPYHSAVAPIIDERSTFILNQLPESVKPFAQENLFVVPCTADVLHQ